ncbi:hypothetical protein HMH01_08830 [Halovulum dunhuangense]|uniref:Relaxasome subunit MobC n=1 Tax=Halovulum dunhuangense TaxID=1505036 RepID=A0A849L2M8_9RHOB|nr:hypothetical protein [Halovulum dunhuangense]NNU80539.1 hypothetical protein [Halovulum dunhuangense]
MVESPDAAMFCGAFRPPWSSGSETAAVNHGRKKDEAERRPGHDIPPGVHGQKENGMSRNQKKIEVLSREIEQKKALLSDLAQKAKEESRRADARRKIIYGGAFLAFLETVPAEQAPRIKARIDAMITNRKDRHFLGLPEL